MFVSFVAEFRELATAWRECVKVEAIATDMADFICNAFVQLQIRTFDRHWLGLAMQKAQRTAALRQQSALLYLLDCFALCF